jgi:hypothetical protein
MRRTAARLFDSASSSWHAASGCVFMMWLFDMPPSWQLALTLLVFGVIAYVVKCALYMGET